MEDFGEDDVLDDSNELRRDNKPSADDPPSPGFSTEWMSLSSGVKNSRRAETTGDEVERLWKEDRREVSWSWRKG